MNKAIAERLESGLFFFFLATLVWAPLPFASNRQWGGGLLAVLVCGALFVWLLLFLLQKVRLRHDVWRFATLPLFLLVCLQCWVALQLLPLPPAVLELLSPRAAFWQAGEHWGSLSLDRQYGQFYLLKGVTYTAAFFLTLVLVNSPRRLQLLLMALVFSGTFQAVYGSLMVLSGLELGFFIEKYAGLRVATGTFINRNHLAGYLVMCLAAGIGLLLAELAERHSTDWKKRVRHWLRLLLSARFRLRIYLGVMVIGLILTRSRGGNIAFFLALAFAGAIALYAGRRFSRNILVLIASLFVVDVLVLGRWFGLERVIQRLGQTSIAEEDRVFSSSYTLEYVGDFPLTGSGGGSFYGVFPNYQQPALEGFYMHAHNDYLEIAAELGIPALLMLLAVGLLALVSAVRAQRERHSRLMKGAAFASTMAVCWAAVHAAVDFNLQIPANALTLVTLIAIAFVARGMKVGQQN